MLPALTRALRSLPDAPGVYIFRDAKGVVLYVGKAASLKSRVRSYFSQPHDARIDSMVSQIARLEIKQTRSALEALFLEAELIKKHQAKYNVMSKDDKTFAYIAVTKEPTPRILVVRPTDRSAVQIAKLFGPYQSAMLARTALKILRRIFPFHSLKTKPGERCFHASLGQCPGVCAMDQNSNLEIRNSKLREYRRTLQHIEMFLLGKRSRLEAGLKLQMRAASRAEHYEEAARLRDRLRALKHINDVALLRDEALDVGLTRASHVGVPTRIEAYDISHTFGHEAVGSMVVFTNGKVDPAGFRKFRIKTVRGIDDTAMLKEVLQRRLRHAEWPTPDLLLMDGGAPQLGAAHEVLRALGSAIPAAALAKGPARKRADLYTSDASVKLIPLSLLVKLREQSHRFAIRYHRTLRARRFLS